MTDLAAPDELQDYVAGVTPDDLAGAVLTGVADQGTKQLLEAEKPVVRAWRKRTGRPGTDVPSTGLALSGGGIRSAAFSLGVIQALVARDLLRRMDYVSSVSGGGYTAASLVWWLSPKAGARFGVNSGDFPYGIEPPGCAGPKAGPEQSALLNFLRQHGSYLTPGHGITLTSAAAAVLRGVILNLLVWLPVLVWVMITLLALSLPAGSGAGPVDGAPAAFDAFLWTALGLGGLFLIAADGSRETPPPWSPATRAGCGEIAALYRPDSSPLIGAVPHQQRRQHRAVKLKPEAALSAVCEHVAAGALSFSCRRGRAS